MKMEAEVSKGEEDWERTVGKQEDKNQIFCSSVSSAHDLGL